jgi:hypothetical protein
MTCSYFANRESIELDWWMELLLFHDMCCILEKNVLQYCSLCFAMCFCFWSVQQARVYACWVLCWAYCLVDIHKYLEYSNQYYWTTFTCGISLLDKCAIIFLVLCGVLLMCRTYNKQDVYEYWVLCWLYLVGGVLSCCCCC